jgi:hypothetical protein
MTQDRERAIVVRGRLGAHLVCAGTGCLFDNGRQRPAPNALTTSSPT